MTDRGPDSYVQRAIAIRPPTARTDWVCAQCVVCEKWGDLEACAEVYVDGQATGFAVCPVCCTFPRATLAARFAATGHQELADTSVRSADRRRNGARGRRPRAPPGPPA